MVGVVVGMAGGPIAHQLIVHFTTDHTSEVLLSKLLAEPSSVSGLHRLGWSARHDLVGLTGWHRRVLAPSSGRSRASWRASWARCEIAAAPSLLYPRRLPGDSVTRRRASSWLLHRKRDVKVRSLSSLILRCCKRMSRWVGWCPCLAFDVDVYW